MGQAKKHRAVKLIVGFIYKDAQAPTKAKASLKRLFGPIDFESKELSFCHTDYYEKEFGSELKRRFIAFEKLILPENLPKIKLLTNKIESTLSIRRLRRINIDPGYIDLAKLLLASTKDYKHRIYLGKGIYAEVTLFFQDKTFRAWEWTYPDYKTGDYIEIFNCIRQRYAEQIKDT